MNQQATTKAAESHKDQIRHSQVWCDKCDWELDDDCVWLDDDHDTLLCYECAVDRTEGAS